MILHNPTGQQIDNLYNPREFFDRYHACVSASVNNVSYRKIENPFARASHYIDPLKRIIMQGF